VALRPDRASVRWHVSAEWLALAVLVLALMVLFGRYAREVHAQSELAAIRATLGAMRTALVVEHLRQQTAQGVAPGLQAIDRQVNPVELLGKPPAGYIGEVRLAEIDQAPAGSWVYAPDCACVGYRPLDADWLEQTSSDGWLWFAIARADAVLQLHTKENYRWRGERVD